MSIAYLISSSECNIKGVDELSINVKQTSQKKDIESMFI